MRHHCLSLPWSRTPLLRCCTQISSLGSNRSACDRVLLPSSHPRSPGSVSCKSNKHLPSNLAERCIAPGRHITPSLKHALQYIEGLYFLQEARWHIGAFQRQEIGVLDAGCAIQLRSSRPDNSCFRHHKYVSLAGRALLGSPARDPHCESIADLLETKIFSKRQRAVRKCLSSLWSSGLPLRLQKTMYSPSPHLQRLARSRSRSRTRSERP